MLTRQALALAAGHELPAHRQELSEVLERVTVGPFGDDLDAVWIGDRRLRRAIPVLRVQPLQYAYCSAPPGQKIVQQGVPSLVLMAVTGTPVVRVEPLKLRILFKRGGVQ